MRILLAWQVCDIGGVETWMAGMARALNSFGHRCELFFFQRGPFADMLPADCTAHFGSLADLLRLVSRESFDVVQAAAIDWRTGVSAVRDLGAKLVLHNNGWVIPVWNSSNCDAIVGCSVWNARAQQALTDVPVQVVPNGVDVQRFGAFDGPIKGPPIVAWVGRGSDLKQKQMDKLAAVAPLLHRGGLRLWLADPDGPTKVPASVARVLTTVAERWAPVPPADMPEFYRQVAASGGCILSTSRFEGLSLAYLEGQSCGCPVIGPDVVGVNESLDVYRGGTLYPPDASPDELADLVQRALGDPERMAWRRRESRGFVVDNFNIEQTARAYLAIYERAPFASRGLVPRLRHRVGRSPLNWKSYLNYCWSPGIHQFAVSKQLFASGERKLARAAVRAAVSTSPTIFIRPKRLYHYLRTLGSP